MGRSQETFGKKEKEKKRQKKKEEKEKKRLERKENSPGGDLSNMMAYVDEYGNITDTPPDPEAKKKVIKAEDIVLGIPQKGEEDPADLIREGKVTFFNDSKGYGFIRDLKDNESYFVHVNGLKEEVGEGDKVSFELEKGQKGLMAVRVGKI
ncbi:MAG: cold shock domain-containing protein [Vicingaceae bacterium]|jgi:cold shock CspA family protein|tara:strand:+ start:125 stop:577 length:453 start_codon:yes stop_codon:yes gene_type:complete